MQLDNFFIRQSRPAMQAVDILRDQADEFSLGVQ